MGHRIASRICVFVAIAALSACTSIQNKAGQRLADSLTAGILEQDDPALARDGIPAWLLLVDGLIQGDPRNPGMLLAGARLYGAYAGGFVEDGTRGGRLAARSLDYARRAACIELPDLCATLDGAFEPFAARVAAVGGRHVAVLHGLASAWAAQIQTHADDWNAIAGIPKVQALFERVVALDDAYAGGEPYMYLGVLASLRPASLGGKPEEGRAAFEKALALSGGRNQMVRVLYAQYYARLVYDQPLHDRLLDAALAADPHAPGLTLINVIAQQRARALRESGKDYF